jgi:hypothetical protein
VKILNPLFPHDLNFNVVCGDRIKILHLVADVCVCEACSNSGGDSVCCSKVFTVHQHFLLLKRLQYRDENNTDKLSGNDIFPPPS